MSDEFKENWLVECEIDPQQKYAEKGEASGVFKFRPVGKQPHLFCPFCGFTDILIHSTRQGYRVVCKRCKTMRYGEDPDELYDFWNTRALKGV